MALRAKPEVFLFGSEDNLLGGRHSDSQLVEIPIPRQEEERWRVEEEFVNAIRGVGPISYTTFEDGVKYMEFTEAVARSTAAGQSVSLPL